MGVGLRFLGRRILVTEEVVPFEKGRCLFFDLLLRDSSKLSFLSCQISNRGPYPFPSRRRSTLSHPYQLLDEPVCLT